MAVGPKCMQTAAKPGQKQSKCFKRRPQVLHCMLCHTTGWTKLKFMANCRQETGWKGGIREGGGRVNVFPPLVFPHRSHLRVSEIPEASLTHISHLQHGTSAHFMTAETAQPNFNRVFWRVQLSIVFINLPATISWIDKNMFQVKKNSI